MFNSKFLSLDIGSKNTKIVLGTQSKKNVIIEQTKTSSFCYHLRGRNKNWKFL